MEKLGFPSARSLDKIKSSLFGGAKTFPLSSRPSNDSTSSGSFANLKLTAEKLVKEQASVKTDLEMANTKVKKLMEHIHELEEKLQNAYNENSKLKVKQKEDEKLWKGIESKYSSTKTLCDQLTETLQQLACQVQQAEKDKEFFEDKLSSSSIAVDDLNQQMNGLSLKLTETLQQLACQVQQAEKDKAFFEDKLSSSSLAIDDLNQQMNGLSLKLESAEESIRNRTKELEELKHVKEERDKFYRDEQQRATNLMEEKDAMIKRFEETVAANRLVAESLNSKLGEVHLDLRLKEDKIAHLISTQENLEKEKSDLQLNNDEYGKKLAMSLHQIKDLEDFVRVLVAQLVLLDKQSLILSDKFVQLNCLYDSCFKMVQQEKNLLAKHSQRHYDQLDHKFLCITSEKDALQQVNQDLSNKIIELQKVQESVKSQLSEECRLAGERIQVLECEAETLVSKKMETEMLVSELKEKIDTLTENARSSESNMQELLLKISTLETETRDHSEKLLAEIQTKVEEIDGLKKEIEKHEEHLDSLEKQVLQLQDALEEKEHIITQNKDTQKKLEDDITEIQALLTAAETKLAEAKKQYDVMLESKKLELSKHLKDLSQRNDQAINDIRRKYEVEKLDIVKTEKEKAEKVVGEIERRCDEKLAESKEESRQYLMHVQEEHAAQVSNILQQHDKKEMDLKADHTKELKRFQIEAENELREKITQIRKEHEAKMTSLRCQHEDEYKKLQEELDLQKSKEERQRALLQLQWKVMGDKPQEDQEVNSKKDHSISSMKMTRSGGGRRSRHNLKSPENEEKDSPLLQTTQTPVSKLLNKVEKENTGSLAGIPTHHKKVTHREYEVETSNGKTVTKRRKTKSTVMFEDPRKNRRMYSPKANTPKDAVKVAKGGHTRPSSNIGDLFSEGSLNPYADDPYAFD